MTDSTRTCTYELDAELRIRAVDEAWSEFARTNDAPELAAPAPLGRPVLDYVQDATTSYLYQRLFDRVLGTARPVTFPFRCDSPEVRRLMEMEIRPCHSAGLELCTRVVRMERRARAPLLDRSVARAGPPLRMCGWCKAVDVGGGWCEVEQAVAALRLFERELLPPITHGICPPCHRRVEGMLERRREA
jgi:hypothetical protein